MMLSLLAMSALAVDLGHARMVKGQLQNAIDVSAHAAAAYISTGGNANLTNVQNVAITTAALNKVNGTGLVLTSSDVEMGRWASGSFTANGVPANAVRITKQVSMGTFFGHAAFGVDSMSAGAQTIVLAPPGGVASSGHCFIPIAVPECLISSGQLNVTFGDANNDNAAWANADGHPSSQDITSMLGQLAAGTCSTAGEASVGSPIYLNNGVQNHGSEVVDAMEESGGYWDNSRWGSKPSQSTSPSSIVPSYDWTSGPNGTGAVLEGVVVVFDSSQYTCNPDGTVTGPNFNQSQTIVGFASAVIYDVTTGNASEKNVKMKLSTTLTTTWGDESDGSGNDYGVDIPPQAGEVVQ